MSRFLWAVWLLSVGGSLLCTPLDSAADSLPQWTQNTDADTSDRPPDPYTTDRSLGYHVLATPAYVLHGVTRPLGWGVKYMEQEFPGIFEGRRPRRGAFPTVEFGGRTGFLGGLVLYDQHLFGSNHRARVRGVYGGDETFGAGGRYRFPSPFGSGTGASLQVNAFSNSEDEFFGGDTSSHPEADEDEQEFSRDQVEVTTSVGYAPLNAVFSGQFDLVYRYANTIPDDDWTSPPLVGFGTVNLLTPRLAVLLDWTRGRPRTYFGTELFLELDYTHGLSSDRIRYGRYVAAVRQYLPIGFLPNTRRLALRARLEQVTPLFGGTDIPFYQLPGVGGPTTLRGFQPRRFQNDGSLVFNVEYRYPIWMDWDAVVFVDAGQVFNDLGEVAADQFRWSYGGGIHMLNRKGLSLRFEVAGSSEGLRTILSVQPTFRRVAW